MLQEKASLICSQEVLNFVFIIVSLFPYFVTQRTRISNLIGKQYHESLHCLILDEVKDILTVFVHKKRDCVLKHFDTAPFCMIYCLLFVFEDTAIWAKSDFHVNLFVFASMEVT